MKRNKQTGLIIILLTALVVLLTVGVALVCSSRDHQAQQPAVLGDGGQYDANVILEDPQTLQDMVDDMVEKAREGQMALEMQVTAYSRDGENFTCYLANAEANSYDMYMILYLDETQEELLQTGLIPVGGRLEELKLQNKLPPGTHTCTLTFVQVEEDRETVHAQVNVGLDLIVTE